MEILEARFQAPKMPQDGTGQPLSRKRCCLDRICTGTRGDAAPRNRALPVIPGGLQTLVRPKAQNNDAYRLVGRHQGKT